MSYIIRVVGYNAYWTGNTQPGMLWSTNLEDSKIFEDKEEAQKIVDNGQNMEVIDYSSALPMVVELKSVPDWDAIDKKVAEIEERKKQIAIPLSDFETISEEVKEVDVEVLD